MPNRWTFTILPIRDLLAEEGVGRGVWVDPFAGKHSPAQITNDLNPEMPADNHQDALTFLKSLPDDCADGLLFDPPYSVNQAKACYDAVGAEKLEVGVTNSKYWSLCYDHAARVVKPHGKIISFGWNSNGCGMSRGCTIRRILLVAHGAIKNDTIVTVEVKDPKTEESAKAHVKPLTADHETSQAKPPIAERVRTVDDKATEDIETLMQMTGAQLSDEQLDRLAEEKRRRKEEERQERLSEIREQQREVHAEVVELEEKLREKQKKLRELEEEAAELGETGKYRPIRSLDPKTSLIDLITVALYESTEPMSITDMYGYLSDLMTQQDMGGDNPRQAVSSTLANNKDRFERVSRGVYRLTDDAEEQVEECMELNGECSLPDSPPEANEE
ncbi:MAG: hypothetical protein ACOX9R_08515 [Armatimonadota bacterium]|jgi:hypothetical protein